MSVARVYVSYYYYYCYSAVPHLAGSSLTIKEGAHLCISTDSATYPLLPLTTVSASAYAAVSIYSLRRLFDVYIHVCTCIYDDMRGVQA